MTDASKSIRADAAPEAIKAAAVSEDRRRPKAHAPYAFLWAAAVLCTVFALTAMLLQR